jgi:hypothetical protein
MIWEIEDRRKKENETLNFVSYQAQQAILNPDLPESYKDEVLRAAVKTILRIADRRSMYVAEPKSWTIR